MQWYVTDQKVNRIYKVKVPLFVSPNAVTTDAFVLFLFVQTANTFGMDGHFYHDNKTLLFEYDDKSNSYQPPESNVIQIAEGPNISDLNDSPTINASVLYKLITKDQEITKSMLWNWLTSRIEVLGPVSNFVARSSKYNFDILLFGDVHDNFNVKGYFSDAEVKKNFKDFFGASSSFYQDNPDFKHFEFIVHKMKTLLYMQSNRQDNTRQFFIWEFLVCLLHVLNQEGQVKCVDVIVEDALDSMYEAEAPENFLTAVRHLFSICPMIANPDFTPFKKFVSRCKKLFPNLRYHRIDLRYQIYEDAKSDFVNDDINGLETCVLALLQLDNANDVMLPSSGAIPILAELMRYHNVTHNDDVHLLGDEIMKMFQQFQTSYLADDPYLFFQVFREASERYWAGEKRSKWFFLRTMITDMYGLSRLYRKNKEVIPGVKVKTHRLQRPTKLCAKSPYELRKVICYLGNYHAKVWRAVILGFDKEDHQIIQDQPENKMNRVMVFDNVKKKPLMPEYWNDPHPLFEKMLPKETDDDTNFFLTFLTSPTLRMYYIPYVANLLFAKTTKLEDLNKRFPDFKFEHTIAAGLNTRRNEMITICQSTTDAFNNDIKDMSLSELDQLYLKESHNDGTRPLCYSADFMFHVWQEDYENRKAFRDPLTRKLISVNERQIILSKTKKETPKRTKNPYVGQHILQAQESTLPHYYIILFRLKQPSHLAGDYFVSFLYLPDTVSIERFEKTGMVKKFMKGIKDFITYSNVKLEFDEGVIRHSGVHFDNWRTKQRWAAKNALQDFQNELAPFIDIEWDRII